MINLKKDTLNLIKLSKKRKASGDFLGAISVLHSDEPFKKENIELLYEQGLFYFEMKNYNFALVKFLIYS